MKQNKTLRLRALIMLAFLAVVAVGYFTVGGIGNVCGVGFGDITLLCPLGALLVMLAQHTGMPLAIASVVAAIIICLLLGKVFCAWACPVPFISRLRPKKRARTGQESQPPSTADAAVVGDAAGKGAADAHAAIRAEAACAPSACATCSGGCGKSKGIKLDSRHGILAAAIVSTLIFGFPVFCLVCPVGLTFATVLVVMQLFAFGNTTWTVIAFPLIILVELFLLPSWCKNFCPLGALHSLFSAGNRTFRPVVNAQACLREGQGKQCNLCVSACPEGINLHDVAQGQTTLNDCSKCRACADACPAKAITFPLVAPKKPKEPQAVPAAAAADAEERTV